MDILENPDPDALGRPQLGDVDSNHSDNTENDEKTVLLVMEQELEVQIVKLGVLIVDAELEVQIEELEVQIEEFRGANRGARGANRGVRGANRGRGRAGGVRAGNSNIINNEEDELESDNQEDNSDLTDIDETEQERNASIYSYF